MVSIIDPGRTRAVDGLGWDEDIGARVTGWQADKDDDGRRAR